jgi:mycofactocin system transcriptional regulator
MTTLSSTRASASATITVLSSAIWNLLACVACHFGTLCQILSTVTSRSDRIKGFGEPGDAMADDETDTGARRRGRPPGTDARSLELIALKLFTLQGFDETTVEQIAAEAGVSRRTFFRYFDTKAAVLWHEFDQEVDALREAFAAVDPKVATMDAIRQVVVSVNRYGADDVAELRTRMNLIGSIPALHASAAPHYDAWERAVSTFAADRSGLPADSLIPLAIGLTTLAACRAAFDHWVRNADADLTVYLDEALAALSSGFSGDPRSVGRAARRNRAASAAP